MADGSVLLVPVTLQALLVNDEVLSAVSFERWTNDYSSLNSFQDPAPLPFTNLADNPVPGVHLHWTLPSALTHGVAPKGSTTAAFPYTPNRWIVARLASTAGSATPPALTAWVIESDYLGQDGTSPFADPTQSAQAPNIALTNLGKNWAITEWSGEPGGNLFLTATGVADAMFTAFQPGLVDVYAFFDDTTGFADGTLLTYFVAGWYSDPTHDPLVTTGLADLGWTIVGTAPATLPTLSVFHGLVYDLEWQTTSAPPRVDADASSMQVAVGYSTADALAAVLATRAGQPGGTLESGLRAFLSDILRTNDARDGQAQLEQATRHRWFGSVPGGTIWNIVAVSQGQQSQDPIDRGAVSPPPELTPQQAEWLAAMNVNQQALDAATRELATMQKELFSAWWKSQYGPVNQAIFEEVDDIDMTFILNLVQDALTPGSTSLLDQVQALQQSVAQQQTALPIPTSPSSIAAFSAQIPGNSSGALALKPQALTPFSQPNDPVVLVTGFSTPIGPDAQALPCRLAGAAVTGVTIAGGTPSTVTAASLGQGTIPGPYFVGGTLPDPAVVSAVAALGVEAFFVDPNNAQSIVTLGNVTPNDSTIVSGLAADMVAGTAQISTVQNPLQASFAFAAWQQAWSPLYLEWSITWFPSVSATPTGPAEPVGGDAQNYVSAQDNFPFDATAWAFDGSDGVADRGYEYYEWQGTTLWGLPGVPPSSYTGRTFLTPHATTLLASRLGGLSAQIAESSLSAGQLEALVQGASQTYFLSQSLGGFNDAFLTWSLQQSPPPPPGSTIASAIGDAGRGVPNSDIGNQDYSFGNTGTPFFFPLRGGFFQFERLQVVDAFGQVLDLLEANGNPLQSGTDQQLAPTFYPILAAGMTPQIVGGGTLQGLTVQRLVNQAPRIVQPNRLDFRLLDADDDAKQVGLSAGANPVCGWLLPNLIDQSITIYDSMGDALGELLVLTGASGTPDVAWLPAPASPNPLEDPARIANTHLQSLVTAFTMASGGIPADQRVASFTAFFYAIDEALWTIDPRGRRGEGALAAAIGRPLALVRAQLQFELYGQPAYNQSWRDTLQSQTSDFTDPAMTFPIRLGSSELLDDGLVGYYTGDSYTTFNAVSPSAEYQAPYVVPIDPDNYLALPFDYPNYSTQDVSLLVDPLGIVVATTGILPALELKIPAPFVDAPIARIAVTPRIGPVLTDPQAVRLPMPADRRGVWSWVTRTGTGDEWSVGPFVAATAQARLADAPPHLIDGWLRFAPGRVNVNDPTLTVGNAPAAVAVTPDSATVFVANSADNTVSVLDAQTFRAVGVPIPVGAKPVALAVLPDDSRVFVANAGDGSLTAIDVATLRVIGSPIAVGTAPAGVAVTPLGSQVFVTNQGSNTVSVIDGQTLQPVAAPPIAVTGGPAGIAISPDGAYVFVASSQSGTVTVIDAQALTIVGSPITVGTTPVGVAVSPDGTVAWVTNQGSNNVTLIDVATLTVAGSPIPVGNAPAGVAVTPDGAYVLVANSKDGSVTVIDANTGQVAAWSPLAAGGAAGVAVAPDNVYTFVTDQSSNTVTVLFPSAVTGVATG